MPQDKSLATKPSTYSCHLLQQSHSVICENRRHHVIYHDLQREGKKQFHDEEAQDVQKVAKSYLQYVLWRILINMTSNDSFNGICILLYRSGGV
jgi:hypothetical protein